MRAPIPQCSEMSGDVDETPTDEVPVPGPGDRPMTLLELTLVAAVVAFWAFRRSTRRLITPTATRESRLSPG